jgi:hypothetical protein
MPATPSESNRIAATQRPAKREALAEPTGVRRRRSTTEQAMRTTETTSDLPSELDHRSNDRIDVWLLWCERDNRVLVAVADEKTGERFEIELREGEQALDVFNHPYAYAAWHGIDTRSEIPEAMSWTAGAMP